MKARFPRSVHFNETFITIPWNETNRIQVFWLDAPSLPYYERVWLHSPENSWTHHWCFLTSHRHLVLRGCTALQLSSSRHSKNIQRRGSLHRSWQELWGKTWRKGGWQKSFRPAIRLIMTEKHNSHIQQTHNRLLFPHNPPLPGILMKGLNGSFQLRRRPSCPSLVNILEKMFFL